MSFDDICTWNMLIFFRCFSVENDVLMMVGTSCKNLQRLNLDGCYRISDQWTCSVSKDTLE